MACGEGHLARGEAPAAQGRSAQVRRGKPGRKKERRTGEVDWWSGVAPPPALKLGERITRLALQQHLSPVQRQLTREFGYKRGGALERGKEGG